MAVENSRTFLDSPLFPPSSREKRHTIQAEQEAKNIGAVIGLVAGVAMVLTQDEQSSTEQQWTEDQQAEQTQQQTM